MSVVMMSCQIIAVSSSTRKSIHSDDLVLIVDSLGFYLGN